MTTRSSGKCEVVCEAQNINGSNTSYLASFSNGQIKKKDLKRMKFKSYENSKTPDGLDRKRVRKILIADTSSLQYCGANYGTQATQRGEQCRHFIGVHNKRTGRMTIHSVHMVHCTPVLSDTVLEDEDDAIKGKSFAEKMDLLTQAFGSKKKRQAMDNRLAYARGNTDEGTSIADSVDMFSLKKAERSVGAAAGTLTAQAIPPQNASARTTDEIYNLQDIISSDEYFAMEDIAKELIKATPQQVQQWKANSRYGQLVLKNLEAERSSLDVNKAKLLIYYDFIEQLSKLLSTAIKKKDPLPNVPEPFKSKLLERFTLSGSTEEGSKTRTMSLAMKDKAMSYAMVLALFVEDFKIDLTILQNDFKKGQMKLVKIAYALGCHVISQKKNSITVKIAELKLPLFVPTGKSFKKI